AAGEVITNRASVEDRDRFGERITNMPQSETFANIRSIMAVVIERPQ
ncbi:MAG: hypothetical protein ACI9G1_005038, partial [Pirellulaceae bacterium]